MIGRLEGAMRRYGLGLWGLALLSAALMPLALHVSSLHRAHWSPGPAMPFWMALAPRLATLWTLIGVLAIAGWAAGTRAGMTGLTPARRALAGAQIGGLAWGVWCGAAVPATVWITRLGVPDMIGSVALGAGILAVVALIAGAVGRWQTMGGVIGGVASGLGLLWVSA